jgi:hypothetical protein
MNQGTYNFVNFEGGAGVTSAQEVDELNKALSAGAGYSGAPTSLSGGGVLQVESLDASLKSVTYEMKQIKLWPQMPKDQAYNTIEEYNRVDAYGDQGRGFIAEGALPRSEDSSYSRQIQRVRFIGVTRELTHVYTLVRNAHGDAIAREIRNGTMKILEIVERSLFDGHGWYASASGLFDGADAALLPEADLAWDGLDKQIRKGNADASAKAKAFTGYGVEEDVIKDLRGLVLDQDALEDGARIVQENFGMASMMMLDTKAHSDLSRQFYPKERINPMGVANGKSGFVLQSFVASAGEFSLVSDVFLRPKRGAPAPLADAPAAPTITSATVVAPTVAGSKFDSASAGTYSYRAAAINAAGEGAQGAALASLAVAAGGAIDVLVAATAGAIAYAIYRAPVGAASGHEFVGYVAPASVGGAATFRDLNVRQPGLAQSYLLTMDSECLRFKQLAPLMKMDLAIVATAYRWMQLLYGTPIVYAPRKHLIYMNIGRSA